MLVVICQALLFFEDWGVTLNQTNIQNNNNKYYIIQVLDEDGDYFCYTRWGRVGENGQNKCLPCDGLGAAQKEFCKKFKEKTKNDWIKIKDNRDAFRSVPRQYTLIDIEHGDGEEEEVEEVKPVKISTSTGPKTVKPCSLAKPTQSLIKLIFDNDMFKEQMKKFDIDVKKLPLGALSKNQINKGYACLDKIENAINKGKSVEELTNQFYTIIPHVFGRTRPPPINDPEIVQNKRDMLAVLGDIEIAQTLSKEVVEEKKEIDHPLDANYKLLDADLEPVERGSEEFLYIDKYMQVTKDRDLELIDVFKVNRRTEGGRFQAHEDVGNRRLLWHGTNVAVVVAILKTGLRIMPHSGGRVGRGIYFASENSKSANYVGPAGDIGIMFLNEVVLGKEHHIAQDDPSLREAPKGYDSIIAKGWTEPDPAKDITVKIEGNDVVVPQGKPIKMPEWSKSTFSQTEYLVYKENQCRIRYLLKIKWS